MLKRKLTSQIQKHVHEECADMLALHLTLDTMIRDTFRDLLRVLDHDLNDYQMSFYNLAVLSCELSRSVFNAVSNGELVAAVGLMRWQVVLSQKTFLFYHNRESYELWKAGENPKEVFMRGFLKKFEAEGKSKKYDSDDETYAWLSNMYHLRYEDLSDLAVISPPRELDDVLKLDLRKYLLHNLKYFARVVRIVIMLHMSAADAPTDRMQQIYDEFKRLCDTILQLLEESTAQENTLIQSRTSKNN